MRAGNLGLSYRISRARNATRSQNASDPANKPHQTIAGLNWTFSARLAVNCNACPYVATRVPLVKMFCKSLLSLGLLRSVRGPSESRVPNWQAKNRFRTRSEHTAVWGIQARLCAPKCCTSGSPSHVTRSARLANGVQARQELRFRQMRCPGYLAVWHRRRIVFPDFGHRRKFGRRRTVLQANSAAGERGCRPTVTGQNA